jgi:hypothetical protein
MPSISLRYVSKSSGTSRADAAVLGAMLLFAIVLALVLLAQVSVVPAADAKIEADHGRAVREDVAAVGAGIAYVASTGDATSDDLDLAPEFPDRVLFVEGAPSNGKLSTTPASASLSNVTTRDGASRYWNGSTHVFAASTLVYEPDYREYAGPTTHIEPGVTFERHASGATTVLGSTDVVSGRRITLTVLTGNLTATTGTATVPLAPVSAPATPIDVTDAGGPIVVELATDLPESEWEALLADEPYVQSVTATDHGTVRIALVPGETYELRLARVHLGQTTATPVETPRYVRGVTGSDETVVAGQSRLLTVEVRDRYNNPVADVPVTAPAPAFGTVTASDDPDSTTTTTDADGHARFVYTAPVNVSITRSITVDIETPTVSGAGARETFTLTVRPAGDFTIENGSIVVNRPYTATVTLVGTAITYGGAGNVPVGVEINVGDDTYEPWPADVNDGHNPRYFAVTNRPANASLSVTATSAVMSVDSTDQSGAVYVLRDGDPVPPVSGYLDQAAAEAYVAPYIDPETNTVSLAENQAIFLFELGTTDLDSDAADFQDAVVVVDLYYE